MKSLRMFAVLAVLAGAGTIAAAASHADVVPSPEPPARIVQWSEVPLAPAAGCAAIYANVLHFATAGYGYYTTPGKVIADDLHMISPGHLCGIDLGYAKLTAGTTSATIRFYANDPADGGPPSLLLAGPYVVNDLASGSHIVHVDLEPGVGPPDLPQDIWLGISFSTTNAGWLFADPPELGTSHDLGYAGTTRMTTQLYPRNYCAAVYASDLIVPTSGPTWGRIKQMYR